MSQRSNWKCCARSLLEPLVFGAALVAAGCGSGGGGGDDDDIGDTPDAARADAPAGCASVTDPIDGDGCCPDGANALTDDDCDPVCPNGVVEGVEECDDDNLEAGDGCDASCEWETTGFRFSSLAFCDPHLWVSVFDVTGDLNSALATALVSDDGGPNGSEEPDGLLDLQFLLEFRPFDPEAPSVELDVSLADCTAPVATTTCAANADGHISLTRANKQDARCLPPLADTTSYGDPALSVTSPPCFVSDPQPGAVYVPIGLVTLPLYDAYIAATYSGTDGKNLVNGMIRGFLTKTDADSTTLPESLPYIGGSPLSSLLLQTDMDTGPGSASGWYVYINFSAVPTTLQ